MIPELRDGSYLRSRANDMDALMRRLLWGGRIVSVAGSGRRAGRPHHYNAASDLVDTPTAWALRFPTCRFGRSPGR
jgi:hypothetical protein